MLLDLLPLFRCPTCKSTLRVVAADAEKNGRVRDGRLHCTDPACAKSYPIKNGIVNFLPHGPGFMMPGTATNHLPLTAWGYERFWRLRALSLLTGEDFSPERELGLIRHAIFTGLDPALAKPRDTHMAVYLDHACSTAFYGRAIAKSLQDCAAATPDPVLLHTPGHVIALDFSMPMLKEAAKYIARDGLSDMFTLVCARAENMPFDDGVFAGIADGGSLNEFADPPRAVQEVSRTLHPAGRAAFMVQMAAQAGRGRLLNKALSLTSGLHFYDLAPLNRMFAAANLAPTEQHIYRLVAITGLAKKV